MENETIDWLRELKSSVLKFLDSISKENYSYIQYSYSGDLLSNNDTWGLGNYVFATKLVAMLDEIINLSTIKKNNLFSNIIGFSKSDGLIFDDIVTKLPVIQKLKFLISSGFPGNEKIVNKIRRAETRQAFSALNLINEKPKYEYKEYPQNVIEVDKYLKSLDWSKPWDAGSHYSHLMFFLKMGEVFFDSTSNNNEELIDFAKNWIFKIQSKDDGSWYIGKNVSLQQRINGSMKVLTGLHAAGIYDFQYPKKLIDLALTAINDEQACDNLNLTYVLYGAWILENSYRKDEIEKFLLSRIKIYRDYYFPELGGFSFFKHKANDSYYGFLISKGLNEPDIHGTTLFIWGISLIDKILNLGLGLIPIQP